MTQDKICPFMSFRDSYAEHYKMCIEDKCMAWEGHASRGTCRLIYPLRVSQQADTE